MTRLLALALAAMMLAGCGAGDPPSVPGGTDLSAFWRAGR